MALPEEVDYMNRLGTRNLRNTNRLEFNCGGYALGSFNWYFPYDENDRLYEEKDTYYYRTFYDMVEQIIADCRGRARTIDNLKELKEGEYAVAFRVGKEDFHFMKMASNGHWFEKRGSKPKIYTVKQSEVFSDSWKRYDTYDSQIQLFAVKPI